MALSWVLSLIAVALVSYHYRQLNDAVHQAGQKIYEFVIKDKEEAEPEVTFLDPDSLEFQVKTEVEEKRKALNPDE